MNVTCYLQQRQYGGLAKKKNSRANVENYVEGKVSTSHVNKACVIPGRSRSTFVMEFSPDGTKVASTHGDHSVRVCEIGTGRCVKTLTGHPRTPWCLAYHPASSHILASGCLHGQVRIWDLYGNGCEVWQTENTTVIASLTFHPTDHVLVIAAGNTLYFWDWSQPEPFARCSTTHDFERIRWVKFDSLGSYLYTGISNNTSIHRDNVTAASTSTQQQQSSEERGQGPPSRLSSVYNNIVNCFHEYQRDRLLQQHNPPHPPWQQRARSHAHGMAPYARPGNRGTDTDRARSPLTVAETFPDTDSEQSRLRQHEILLGSYSDLLDQRARASGAEQFSRPATSSHGTATSRASGLGMDCLLNPTSDPFLPSVPDQGYVGDVSGLGSGVTETQAGASGGVEGVGARRGVYSPPPAQLTDSLDQVRSAAANILSENSLLGFSDSDSLYSSAYGQTSSQSANTDTDSVQALSNSLDTDETPSSSASHLGQNCLPPRNCDSGNETVRSSSSDVHVSCDNTAVSSASTTSQPSRLTSYLRQQPTAQHFRSIRDRLQTSIPLSVDSNSGLGGGSVRVVSATDMSSNTVPQVTVISGTSLGTNTSTLASTSCPSRAVSSQAGAGTFDDYTGNLISRLVQGQTTSNSQTGSGSSSVSSVCDSSVGGQSESNTNSTSNSTSTPSTNSATLGDSSSSLLQSMFPRHGNVTAGSYSRHLGAESRWRTRPVTTRSHPYHLLNRQTAPYLPLLGPYLESRGLRNRQDASTEANTLPSTSESMSFVPQTLPCSSSFTLSSGPTRGVSRGDNQTPSDTENEVSSHLTQSGAYFMPISADPLRTLSSASSCSTSSADRNSNPILSSGDPSTEGTVGSRSSSQGQGQDLELLVDQNDNYSASQMPNANLVNRSEIRHETQDDNNNSIHIVQPEPDVQPTIHTSQSFLCNPSERSSLLPSLQSTRNTTSFNTSLTSFAAPQSVSSSLAPPPGQDYVTLRNTFFNMTSQIEREMSDLNRRINALRESFNESLLALRQDRQRFESLGSMIEETATGLPPASSVLTPSEDATPAPAVAVSQASELGGQQVTSGTGAVGAPECPLSQPLTLLESSLRSHRWNNQNSNIHDTASAAESAGSQQELLEREAGPSWRYLQRHYLHPHYSNSILDETINRPNTAIQSAINRAIAGAFMGTGEAAVANNIINQTHRLQYWDFSKCRIPDIATSTQNVVVGHCKLHNSASCDISADGTLLATFVPSHQGFPDDNILTVVSLRPDNRGQCLYTKSFGPNAISISISPANNHVLVGLAAKRLSWVFTSDQLVAQIYRLEKEGAGEKSMKHVKDIMHACSTGVRSHVSGNSARWLPLPGQGLVYGTNRGDLHLCRPGVKVVVEKTDRADARLGSELGGEGSQNIRRSLLGRVPWLSHSSLSSSPHRISTSTQTHGVRRSASTQTGIEESTNTHTGQDDTDTLVWL